LSPILAERRNCPTRVALYGEKFHDHSLLIFATIMILAVRFVRGGFMEIIQVISPRLRDKYLMLIGKRYRAPREISK
jgi:hypothetical protein